MIQSRKLLNISELSPMEVQRDVGVWGSRDGKRGIEVER